jgi:2'-5' RNA ligase
MPDAIPAPFLRLFIALAVPAEVRQAIGRVQSRLRREASPGTVRWAPADQFHLTLRFLGDVPAEQVARLEHCLKPVCAGSPALLLSARGLGFFPNPHHPRVIWVGASEAEGRLRELHHQIDTAVRWLAPAEPPEKYSAHITLGRLKPGGHAGIPKLLRLAEDFHGQHFGDWRAGQVELVRSELTSVRAEHTVIAAFPFAN